MGKYDIVYPTRDFVPLGFGFNGRLTGQLIKMEIQHCQVDQISKGFRDGA